MVDFFMSDKKPLILIKPNKNIMSDKYIYFEDKLYDFQFSLTYCPQIKKLIMNLIKFVVINKFR
ncbi:hypothetical protein AMJ44_12585 [candidate division WOR-1 bacterium DG_54_3]|uniref:Uncharacterized protein n=1 Tax=candidate division WOR-1 bacterium DG_54_3 TaxID=1703775 RepID=A0A0S7XQ66_UNCSA|nr:MAG: hypothetical protein AMJ44_12585 [candidate division WOR-1 bacterium DG_54_3]